MSSHAHRHEHRKRENDTHSRSRRSRSSSSSSSSSSRSRSRSRSRRGGSRNRSSRRSRSRSRSKQKKRSHRSKKRRRSSSSSSSSYSSSSSSRSRSRSRSHHRRSRSTRSRDRDHAPTIPPPSMPPFAQPPMHFPFMMHPSIMPPGVPPPARMMPGMMPPHPLPPPFPMMPMQTQKPVFHSSLASVRILPPSEPIAPSSSAKSSSSSSVTSSSTTRPPPAVAAASAPPAPRAVAPPTVTPSLIAPARVEVNASTYIAELQQFNCYQPTSSSHSFRANAPHLSNLAMSQRRARGCDYRVVYEPQLDHSAPQEKRVRQYELGDENKKMPPVDPRLRRSTSNGKPSFAEYQQRCIKLRMNCIQQATLGTLGEDVFKKLQLQDSKAPTTLSDLILCEVDLNATPAAEEKREAVSESSKKDSATKSSTPSSSSSSVPALLQPPYQTKFGPSIVWEPATKSKFRLKDPKYDSKSDRHIHDRSTSQHRRRDDPSPVAPSRPPIPPLVSPNQRTTSLHTPSSSQPTSATGHASFFPNTMNYSSSSPRTPKVQTPPAILPPSFATCYPFAVAKQARESFEQQVQAAVVTRLEDKLKKHLLKYIEDKYQEAIERGKAAHEKHLLTANSGGAGSSSNAVAAVKKQQEIFRHPPPSRYVMPALTPAQLAASAARRQEQRERARQARQERKAEKAAKEAKRLGKKIVRPPTPSSSDSDESASSSSSSSSSSAESEVEEDDDDTPLAPPVRVPQPSASSSKDDEFDWASDKEEEGEEKKAMLSPAESKRARKPARVKSPPPSPPRSASPELPPLPTVHLKWKGCSLCGLSVIDPEVISEGTTASTALPPLSEIPEYNSAQPREDVVVVKCGGVPLDGPWQSETGDLMPEATDAQFMELRASHPRYADLPRSGLNECRRKHLAHKECVVQFQSFVKDLTQGRKKQRLLHLHDVSFLNVKKKGKDTVDSSATESSSVKHESKEDVVRMDDIDAPNGSLVYSVEDQSMGDVPSSPRTSSTEIADSVPYIWRCPCCLPTKRDKMDSWITKFRWMPMRELQISWNQIIRDSSSMLLSSQLVDEHALRRAREARRRLGEEVGTCARIIDHTTTMKRVRERRFEQRLEKDQERRDQMRRDWESSQASATSASGGASGEGGGGGGSTLESSRQGRAEMRLIQRTIAPITSAKQHDEGSASSALMINALATRAKKLRFDRSPIHDWGLFAAEPILEGDMVIEYIGESIRARMADVREKHYENIGIGSSYLFRIDGEYVIDATVKGNHARFINHTCDPNCAPRIIFVANRPRIVIYAKKNIAVGEELSYDYKFPIAQEGEPILPCLCGAAKCHKYLNWVGEVPSYRKKDIVQY